jgi:transposase-like protein
MDRTALQELLAERLSLAEIGRRHGLHEATVAYWVDKHGLTAAHRDKCAAKGGLARERLDAMVRAGMSVAEIAGEVGRSKTTVRYWLREYRLRTQRSQRREAISAADPSSRDMVLLDCATHGQTHFKLTTSGGYRCLRCRSEAVTRRRRKVKRTLVEEAGGACQICGYARCIAALAFHHVVPAEKRFALSLRSARSLDSLRAEAKKCALLCANCHCEVELGVVALPRQCLASVE